MASAPSQTRVDIEKSLAFWKEYQEQHDLHDRIGQAAGIDPENREVHFGESAAEIATRMMAEGRFRPLFFVRVGFRTYGKKVGTRWLKAK